MLYLLITSCSLITGGKPKLQDGDAVLVARSWFNAGETVTLAKIAQECDDQG